MSHLKNIFNQSNNGMTFNLKEIGLTFCPFLNAYCQVETTQWPLQLWVLWPQGHSSWAFVSSTTDLFRLFVSLQPERSCLRRTDSSDSHHFNTTRLLFPITATSQTVCFAPHHSENSRPPRFLHCYVSLLCLTLRLWKTYCYRTTCLLRCKTKT